MKCEHLLEIKRSKVQRQKGSPACGILRIVELVVIELILQKSITIANRLDIGKLILSGNNDDKYC